MTDLLKQNHARLGELCHQFEVRRLAVFGSAVRDDFDPRRSDLDFLVDFRDGALSPADTYFGLLFALEDLFERKIDLVEEKALRNPYVRRAVEQEQQSIFELP